MDPSACQHEEGIADGEDQIMNVKSKQGSNASSPRAALFHELLQN